MAEREQLASERVFRGLAGFLAVTAIVVGISAWLGAEIPGNYPRPATGVAGVSVGACMLAGVWAFGRLPVVGALLILPVSVPLAVLLAWAAVPPIAVLLLFASWMRARWLATRAA